jgi:hypothetical protein
MFLQFDQIIKGIGRAPLARINESHKQVADLSAVLGFIEKGSLPMQDGLFQRSFADLMPTPGLCRVGRLLMPPAYFPMVACAA